MWNPWTSTDTFAKNTALEMINYMYYVQYLAKAWKMGQAETGKALQEIQASLADQGRGFGFKVYLNKQTPA